jgi:hypothetical protein
VQAFDRVGQLVACVVFVFAGLSSAEVAEEFEAFIKRNRLANK